MPSSNCSRSPDGSTTPCRGAVSSRVWRALPRLLGSVQLRRERPLVRVVLSAAVAPSGAGGAAGSRIRDFALVRRVVGIGRRASRCRAEPGRLVVHALLGAGAARARVRDAG